MSVFNGERYVGGAIESILKQTHRDFEFIVIDDGSKDRTLKILRSFSDPRLFIHVQKNEGLTKSLNKAIAMARGEYLARQDADDFSCPDRLEKQVCYLDANPEIGLLGTHVTFIDEEGHEFYVWKMPTEHSEIRMTMIEDSNSFCHGAVLFRKECVATVGYYREAFQYTQDYDLWLRISDRYRVANLPEVLYRFRRSSGTISRKKLSRQIDYHILAIELAKERQRNGVDSLNRLGNGVDVRTILNKTFGLSSSDLRKYKSRFFIQNSSESFRTGDYFDALKFWANAFISEPGRSKVSFLIGEFRKRL